MKRILNDMEESDNYRFERKCGKRGEEKVKYLSFEMQIWWLMKTRMRYLNMFSFSNIYNFRYAII